ncbi:Polyisoprenyl-teichoic acid--peptidoglycan teichoic acid transferase TagU [Planktothrix tepida]|uniref:Cell envelope-related transcriptional attenuator n=1 Tax=Planktothrix tepida PCC 9214 TaxID=671072 RepID=A0A1J1LJB6_9CYAN|nr:LCP family protein [Planktothrix tepida]CAD5950974.1 Polyisoprenyl-teichoic acid--peptidoglycan teichoic acid transferase TagU [Planktothrix tepida]CUR32600.1 Cell envelope-related transcriptional attenuator [Planktothrix tepida PCC 9214]
MTSPFPYRQKPKILQLIFFSFIVLLLASISAILGAMTALLAPEKFDFNEPELNILDGLWRHRFKYNLSRSVNILVLGIDGNLNQDSASPDVFKGRSDTVLLVGFEPQDKSVSLLSIPRDTQVEIPGYGTGKINEANYWGGAQLAQQVIQNTLNKVEVNRYVRVSSGAFRELVDFLGGVEVYIPQPMSYQDKTQQLKIDLAPGWQTINGEQADQFVRFRGDGYGDLGRVQRQQALMEAILVRLKDPTVLPRVPEIIRIMQKYIDTNLSFEEILTLVNFGLNLEPQNFKMVMLPGRSSSQEDSNSSYWFLDEQGRDRVMYQYFRLDSTGYTLKSSYEPSAYDRLSKDLKIAVQNASGHSTGAEKMLNFLSNQGFNQVYLAPIESTPQLQTQIIVQGGDLGAAKLMQKALGLGEIKASATGELGSDLTIRVGEDWIKNK